jgi:chromosome segregation protein
MRISRLRLTGFKSFVEPTELRIESGLTGVVGPNGCGKSNLLEAIRWVMGESSPKSMRSGGMDDVIFAGTETRPSRDFAEVALVCDTEGAALPGLVAAADGGALEVVRRIERGAGSAYRANGQDVRARDVALIFADAATGAHSPALVSQGKVAGIIAAKPQERRQLLEEAAGIAGLHVRRKDAEQKLRATETNLGRLADLLSDMDQRASALRRQARAAERYTRLSDQIRIAEGRMIFARWRDAAAAADVARVDAQSAEAAVESAGADQHAAAAAQAEAMATLVRLRDLATSEREAEHAAAARLTELRSERQALERHLADLVAEQARIERDRQAEDALARDGAAAIERLEEVARQSARQIGAREKERPGLEERLAAGADRLRDTEVTLAEMRAVAANESAERRIAEAAHAESTRRLARIEAELERLEQEARSAGDGEALAAQLKGAQTAAQAAETAIADAEAAFAKAQAVRVEAAERRAQADAAHAEAKSALSALESEAAALDRSLRASAGSEEQLLAHLRADPGYEAALAAALGDDLTAPLLGDASDAEVRGWLGSLGQRELGDPPLAKGLVSLADHVTAPTALARRLAQIAVADHDEGQQLAVGQRMVTRDGRLRRWDGFVSFGDGAATAERLARSNRREAIAAQLPQVRVGVEQIAVALAETTQALADADTSLVAAQKRVAGAENDARLVRRAADAAESALARYTATAAHLAQRREAGCAEQADAREAHALTAANLAALPDGGDTAGRLQTCEAATATARQLLAADREALSLLDRDVARLREAQIEAQAEVRGWKARAGEAARRIAGMNDRLSDIARDVQMLDGKPEALQSAIAEMVERAASISLRVAEAVAGERQASEAAQVADQRLEAAREILAAAREARAGAAARAENAEHRRIEMGRISGERFSCPPPLLPEKVGFEAADVASPQDESAAHERFNQERERIGPVNLVAAQELADLELEQAGSAAEAEELQLAVNRLRGSIGHLNREGRQRLTEAFEQVDGHFRSLFSTLFGGGQAHLAMVDSDDPLEAGLEIMAQPPGKKLASLTLLSGGEQALTAVALIFALFLTNPAPICVLDEVDAPLDDANVERFCDLLDRMVRETATRYLIVTHNAVTMSRMHRLFGVTMVERGVSRLVSVDLGKATELVAAE